MPNQEKRHSSPTGRGSGEGYNKISMPKSYFNVDFARELRQRETLVEKLLWRKLRNRKLCGCKFRRQACIGRYVADFLCYEKKLVIELDGSIHTFRKKYDAQREEFLMERGFTILRFKNHVVEQDINAVVGRIMEFLV